MQSIRLQRKSHQNAQLYLTTMRYSTADVENLTDIVVEVVAEVVARQAADMKNPTATVVEAAEVVARRVEAEVIVTVMAVVLDHRAAAKTSKKRRILFSLIY